METGARGMDPGSMGGLGGKTRGGKPGNLALTWSAKVGWGNFTPPLPNKGNGKGNGGSLGTGRPSRARRSAC